MSARVTDALEARPVARLSVRLTLLGALLLGEGALLALAFDVEPLSEVPHPWWVGLISRAGFVMPLVTAIMTATALLGGTRLRAELAASLTDVSERRIWPWLAGHFATFTAFLALSAIVLANPPSPFPVSGWVAIVWALSGAAAVAVLAPAALPMPTFVTFLRRALAVLATCAVVGAVGWGMGEVTGEWWHTLGRSTLSLVFFLLRHVFPDAMIDPASFVVGTSRFQVEIATRCSGYEGIGLIWVFLAVYLWTFRRSLRFPRALLLLPLGTVIIWLANVLRITGLIWVGTVASPEVAVGGFHANSGSLLLCIVALGMGWAANHSRVFTRTDDAPVTAPVSAPVAAYLLPFLLAVAAALISGLAARDGFDAFYGLRVLVAGVVLAVCRSEYPAWRWSGAWSPLIGGVTVAALWIVFAPAPTSAPDDTATALAAMPPALAAVWMACRVFGAVVTVPLVEELAFRGYLARRLVAPDFVRVSLAQLPWLPILVSSILFGMLHQRFVVATLAGVVYALVARQRGTLADAVLAHAITNAVLAAWVMGTGHWSSW